MIKQQKILIIVIASVLLLMAILYFAVVKPIVEREEVVTTEPIETVDGEIIGANDRYQLFEQVTRADMQSIEIVNEYGSYKFVRDASDSFVIESSPSTLYNAELFSTLVVDTGYPLSKTKIVDNAKNDLYKYGLSEEDKPAYYEITTLSGKKHKVYVGDKIPTGGGYYVYYEGRDTVYVLDTSLGNTILRPVETYVTPLLLYPTSINTYFYIEDFAIFNGAEEDPFVRFKYLKESERSIFQTYSAFTMLEPGNGYYCPSGILDSVLQSFVNYQGSSVVKLDPSEDELLEIFTDTPEHLVYLVNNVPENEEQTKFYQVPNLLYFSKQQDDGSYYCYSALFDIIAIVPEHMAEFLTYDLNQWVNQTIYQVQIDKVATMQFISDIIPTDNHTVTFELTGDGEELVVVERETGHKPIVKNFRQLYKTLLSCNKVGFHERTEDEVKALKADSDNLQLIMKITLRNGESLTYTFTNYSDRRSLYSINELDTEFYVLRTLVKKISNDVVRVMEDKTVDSEDKY